MTVEQFEVLLIIKNKQESLEERQRAAFKIARIIHGPKIDDLDLELFFEAVFEFWKSLGITTKDKNDPKLYFPRKRLATICQLLSRRMPGGQKIFSYYPKLKQVEAVDDRNKTKIIKGETKTGYGTSLYEFHWEYPIEGIGIRKDRISVITADNKKIPMLEWCKQNEIVVYCNRCGLDITYEVSKNCPFMERRYKSI